MANYPQELAQDAVCQSHTSHMTGLWFLPARPQRLNTNEWMNLLYMGFHSASPCVKLYCIFTNETNLRYTVHHMSVTHSKLNWNVWLKTSDVHCTCTLDGITVDVWVIQQLFCQAQSISTFLTRTLIIPASGVKRVRELQESSMC